MEQFKYSKLDSSDDTTVFLETKKEKDKAYMQKVTRQKSRRAEKVKRSGGKFVNISCI